MSTLPARYCVTPANGISLSAPTWLVQSYDPTTDAQVVATLMQPMHKTPAWDCSRNAYPAMFLEDISKMVQTINDHVADDVVKTELLWHLGRLKAFMEELSDAIGTEDEDRLWQEWFQALAYNTAYAAEFDNVIYQYQSLYKKTRDATVTAMEYTSVSLTSEPSDLPTPVTFANVNELVEHVKADLQEGEWTQKELEETEYDNELEHYYMYKLFSTLDRPLIGTVLNMRHTQITMPSYYHPCVAQSWSLMPLAVLVLQTPSLGYAGSKFLHTLQWVAGRSHYVKFYEMVYALYGRQ